MLISLSFFKVSSSSLSVLVEGLDGIVFLIGILPCIGGGIKGGALLNDEDAFPLFLKLKIKTLRLFLKIIPKTARIISTIKIQSHR